jgi:hypothetical protein
LVKIIISILFFFPIWLSAQDITGVWTGYIETPGSKLDYELAISEGGKKLTGYSLIIYPKDGIENIGIKKAKIKQGKKNIYFEDGELVYDNFTTPPIRMKMFGNLSLTIKDTLMILQGSFSTRSLDFRDTRTYSGEIYLQKTGRPLSSKLLVTLEEINFPHHLSFVTPVAKNKTLKQPNNIQKLNNVNPIVTIKPKSTTDRKIEKIRDIDFNSDSLLLSFYDNGTIDGDTITVALNGNTLVEKLGLTAKAFKITIPAGIRSGDSLLLVMHAESLGLIPPNTGLLIIQDGETRHEIRFEGDLQRSSAVLLRKNKL